MPPGRSASVSQPATTDTYRNRRDPHLVLRPPARPLGLLRVANSISVDDPHQCDAAARGAASVLAAGSAAAASIALSGGTKILNMVGDFLSVAPVNAGGG